MIIMDMQRTHLQYLKEWLNSEQRKPLVIRGARQVGKTWLVRHFAESQGRRCIELNLEKKPKLISLFSSNDPHQFLLNLSAAFNEAIEPEHCILFFDEIQVAPDLLAKLRWFAEDMPEMPVIAAGSLLEFVLAEHSFSMPVGRISYLHLEPLSFEEFLLALGKQSLFDYLSAFQWGMDIPLELHQQLIAKLKEYIVIGGMPAAVSSWITHKSLQKIDQIQHELMATYRDDFAKYSGRLTVERLEEVCMAIPQQLGGKFVYSKVNPIVQIEPIKKALELLARARICYRVKGCAANGVPLKAEINDKDIKVIFLDVGLCSSALGLSLDQFQGVDAAILVNKGGIAEQLVGQIMRTIEPPYREPMLYYWRREKQGSAAEIDYVLQHQNLVIPIEVKAGSTGSLKSLHLFMGLKKLTLAVRVNADLPSHFDLDLKDSQGNPVSYKLLSLPFYLLGQLHRLLNTLP